jgi:hypothetical protein
MDLMTGGEDGGGGLPGFMGLIRIEILKTLSAVNFFFLLRLFFVWLIFCRFYFLLFHLFGSSN